MLVVRSHSPQCSMRRSARKALNGIEPQSAPSRLYCGHRLTGDADYPAVLFVMGDTDARVAPLLARETTALMQEATGSSRPTLLTYEPEAGHCGRAARRQGRRQHDHGLLFFMWRLRTTGGGASF